MKERLEEILFKSLSYGLILSVLAFFMGWIKYSSSDPLIACVPVFLQVIRIFVIGVASFFVAYSVVGLVQMAIKKRKNKK